MPPRGNSPPALKSPAFTDFANVAANPAPSCGSPSECWLFDDTTDAKHSNDLIDELGWPEGLLKEGPV